MLGPMLQYQSLKTVLLHTDANTRFRISACMPSIREVEKRVPLKMDTLEMDDYRTVVNDTEFQIGVIRHYPEGVAPSSVKKDQDWVVSYNDFDEFGFPFNTDNNVLLPGDVSFKRENRAVVRREDTERDERRFRDNLTVHEEAVKVLEESKAKGMTVKDYLDQMGSGIELRNALVQPTLLFYKIEHYKHLLLPFECRRNNTKPPFTCYIQLTVTKGESKQIHRFEYNKKLFEAFKDLHEVFFGGRSEPNQVDRLPLNSYGIIRLPTGFRLHANHVRTCHYTLAHANFPSLVENSESLESIEMTPSGRETAFDTRAVRAAKRLVIESAFFYILRLTEVIQNLSNLEITIVGLFQTPEQAFSVIQAWLTADRPVGACCWIELMDEKIAEEVLKLVQTSYESTKSTSRCVTIQKTNSTRVEVSYVPFETQPRASLGYKPDIQWMLKTRIVNV